MNGSRNYIDSLIVWLTFLVTAGDSRTLEFINGGEHRQISRKNYLGYQSIRRSLKQTLAIRILPSLQVISILFFMAGCFSPVSSIPGTSASTLTATRTPILTQLPIISVTPTTPADSKPTADIQNLLQTEVPPRIHGSYPSPDGNWEAQVIIYDCKSVDPEAPGGNSLEQLVLTRLTDSTRTVVDSQFIYCGGLGASGLEGKFWTNDSKFFFYTSAREGVPDGCGFWTPPLLRVGITEPKPTYFGSPAISPDGKMIAAWVADQLEIWQTSGDQMVIVQNPVPGANPGPIAWSPDNRSVAYLLSEDNCPPGETYLVTVTLTDMEPVLVLISENPSFVNVSWDDIITLKLFDEGNNSWSLDLRTGQLTGPSD